MKVEQELQVLQNQDNKEFGSKTAKAIIKEYIDSNSLPHTNKITILSDLSDCIDDHVREISGTK